MSYVLHFWQQPADQALPTSVRAADQLLSQLRQTQPGQNPAFINLAERLTRRYPCICSDKAERMPESEWAWSDGPLNGKTEAAVYGIGLNVERLDEVRPFVIEQAKALGLNVMDEQAGEVFLAEGTVLAMPRPASAKPQKDYDDVPTRAALDKIVFERLTPFLAEYGFKAKKSDHSFKRTFPAGWQIISIASGDTWPREAGFSLGLEVRWHEAALLIDSIIRPDEPPQQGKHRPTGCSPQPRWMDEIGAFQDDHKCFVIYSYSDIDAMMARVFEVLQTRLLPILEKCKTLKGLDEVLNSLPLEKSIFQNMSMFAFRNLIVAYLAQSPNLEGVCREIEEERTRYPNANIEVYKCLDYVRQRMQPASA
ncbi:MAG: sel1 repeat family protein [Proteobacteria bacterium]|nr:sel1 repeat family protein [Pseudomonadota bacterium]